MKFEFKWPNSLLEKDVLIYLQESNTSDLAEKSMVNLDLWDLFISIVSLG